MTFRNEITDIIVALWSWKAQSVVNKHQKWNVCGSDDIPHDDVNKRVASSPSHAEVSKANEKFIVELKTVF